MSPLTVEAGVCELSPAEGREFVEGRVRGSLGMSLAEFRRDYAAGRLDIEARGVLDIVLLLPFAQ